MKWHIPAKTFLLGEYAALAGGPAILLSTKPYFEVSLTKHKALHGIHPASPAGVLWNTYPDLEYGLSWVDPYQGRGGLGASSAQFLGAYLALCTLHQKTPNLDEMLQAYFESSWSGVGLKPSGYDVLAQSQQACVSINAQQKSIPTYPWPFETLSFFLIHTGVKLATHEHLKETTLPSNLDRLSSIVRNAQEAFETQDAMQLIHAVNGYHEALIELERVAPHTKELISQLRSHPEILAIKGCGALGADIILILTQREQAEIVHQKLTKAQYIILATENDLSMEKPLIA